MAREIDNAALDQLFLSARTRNRWSDRPVTAETLRRLYDVLKMGPTTSNSLPARFVFLTSHDAKRRIEPALDEGNRAKSMQAPVLTIVAYDLRFYEFLGDTFAHNRDARSWFEGKPDLDRTALRNGTLQGAYLILAARALGLDCGPMSGFNEAKVNAEFFPDGRWRANFLCALGHADDKPFPRLPRLPFETACRVL